MPPRVAVVLFNLGGPDSPAAIKPFLLNLFRDPAILRVPFFVRPFLARWIARARLKPATANYALLGGKSPLLELTELQANELAKALPELDVKCFVAMRYWHPFSSETAVAVKQWRPDEILLLPLYPHYSTTTTGSSLTAWREAAAATGLVARTTALCCYPTDLLYVSAILGQLKESYGAARRQLPPDVALRVLFSAHGLPETIVRAGDPYQWQIEQTVAAVVAAWRLDGLDWAICYQSRATPQVWITPSTETEIARAAQDKVAVLVVPIAFVSEHSETLVELDIEYRHLADQLGVPGYFRVPTPDARPDFITALASLVGRMREFGPGLCSQTVNRICPADRIKCPLRALESL